MTKTKIIFRKSQYLLKKGKEKVRNKKQNVIR